MKQLLFGLIAAVMIAGCTTTPEPENDTATRTVQSGEYAIQIIEANIKGDGLTGLMPELFWDPATESIDGVEVITSKNTVLSEGEDASGKLHKAWLPRPEIQQATIDKILAMANADTYEYPVLHATLGETAVCDQTESKEMLKDAQVVDGQTVKTMETVKLGHYAEATLQTTTNACLTCSLKVENKSLFGTQTYALENGDQIEMPYYDGFSINSASLPVDENWVMQALSIGEETQNGITTGTAHLVFVRVIPQDTQERSTL